MSDPNPADFQAPPPPPETPPEVQGARPVKLRPVAIGLFVLGLLCIGLGFGKVLSGGVGTGAALVFGGMLLFGLSFIRLPIPDPNEPPLPGHLKVRGVFYHPTSVFRNLRSHPYWLAAFLVIGITNIVYENAFVARVGSKNIVDFTMQKLEESPIKPPPEAMDATRLEQLQELSQPIRRVQAAAKKFVGILFLSCFGAMLYLAGILAFGGRINFWQALAAALYSSLPVIVLTKLSSLIILFVKDPGDIHPILGQESLMVDNLGFLFAPSQHPALFVLATSISILSFYGLWLRAKALADTGQKVSSSAAWSVTIILWVLGLIIGMVFATLFSSFIS